MSGKTTKTSIRIRSRSLLWRLACIALLSAVPSAQAKAQNGEIVFHVAAAQSPARQDADAPPAAVQFSTIQSAIDGLPVDRTESATIFVEPGVYRETITIPAQEAPLRLIGTEAGQVVVSGAVAVDEWRETSPGLYRIPLLQRMPLSDVPQDWPSRLRIGDRARERQFVIVGGRRLPQVSEAEQLVDGSAYFPPSDPWVLVRLPPGVDLRRTTLEIAVRPTLLAAQGSKELTIANLTFQHAASGIEEGTVTILDTTGLTMTDNRFVENNGVGLVIGRSSDLRIERNLMNGNGHMGLGLWRVSNAKLSENETSENNWRGIGSQDLTDWANAGMKVLQTHDAIFRRHRAIGNLARGIWFDSDISRVELSSSVACRNLHDGLMIEATQGLFVAHDNRICGNGGAGVLAAAAQQVTFVENQIRCNRKAQFLISGDPDRGVIDQITGRRLVVNNLDWALTGNTIISDDAGAPLIGTTLSWRHWQAFVTTLRSTENVWKRPAGISGYRLIGKQAKFCRTAE